MSKVVHFFIDIYTLNSIHDNQKAQKSPSTLQNTYTIIIKNYYQKFVSRKSNPKQSRGAIISNIFPTTKQINPITVLILEIIVIPP